MDYNKTKSGVDVLDHMLKEYRPYQATRRWPCVIFFDLLSIASQAAYIIFMIKFPQSKMKQKRKFLYQLGTELVLH